jgi:hypothetical protein
VLKRMKIGSPNQAGRAGSDEQCRMPNA